MGIPIANRYAANVTGTILKFVACEQCTLEYIYEMSRSAEGTGTSLLFLDNKGASDRAELEARDNLRKKLEEEYDAVPCPQCGWYQAHMIPIARSAHRRGLQILGWCLAAPGIAGSLVAFTTWMGTDNHRPSDLLLVSQQIAAAVMFVGLPLGLVILAHRRAVCRRFEPNEDIDVETRRQEGQSRATTRKHLEESVRQRLSQLASEAEDPQPP